MDKRNITLWLNSIIGIRNRTIDKLEAYLGSLEAIWNTPYNQIKKISFLNEDIINSVGSTRNENYIKELIRKLKENNINFLTIYDDEYPNSLKNIYDPPKILYIKGNINKEDSMSIAIVGSRKATSYGKWAADKFSRELSRMGITVISGMARGIDTIAHKGAFSENGRTIAVLGNGVDIIYPPNNIEIYNHIVDNGAVISEFPIGMKPLPYNFPMRNRIISGLALGVIVIEATEKSGSLITANHALDQGREVFALPGNINSIYSRGTNKLIKDGAKILTDIDDILEEISILNDKFINNKNEINYETLGKDEIQIVKSIEEYPMNIDNIAFKVRMNISKVSSILTILEMKGIVTQLPGRIYALR